MNQQLVKDTFFGTQLSKITLIISLISFSDIVRVITVIQIYDDVSADFLLRPASLGWASVSGTVETWGVTRLYEPLDILQQKIGQGIFESRLYVKRYIIRSTIFGTNNIRAGYIISPCRIEKI